MSETDLKNPPEDTLGYSGKTLLHRERGVSALDIQHAADALLRRGQKPSVVAVREQLGGGSPNTVGPLLEQYWRGLGTRLPAGPEALERVPESLARMTEALWLRSLDEARETAKALHRTASPSQQSLAALEQKAGELSAALAQSRAQVAERESELLSSLKAQVTLKEQVRQLTSLLAAEQALRAQDQQTAATQRYRLDQCRSQLMELSRRRLAAKMDRKVAADPKGAVRRKAGKVLKSKAAGKPASRKRKYEGKRDRARR